MRIDHNISLRCAYFWFFTACRNKNS